MSLYADLILAISSGIVVVASLWVLYRVHPRVMRSPWWWRSG